jgi:hypothetical protein
LPIPIGAIRAFTPEASNLAVSRAAAPEIVVPRLDPLLVPAVPVRRAVNPQGDGIFVIYQGQRWVSAGPAVLMSEPEFVRSGEYAGFPVYTRRDQEDVIYLPSAPALLAPYRLKKP